MTDMGFLTRRHLLGTITASATLAFPSAKGGIPLRVVVTGGHPGDPEYGCGGTVARFTEQGHEVTLLYLNSGQKSCPPAVDDPGSRVREAEAKTACTILKAKPVFAGQCDGHAIVDERHYDDFRSLIDQLRPDALFTQWPLDGHRDHRATFMLSYDAWLRSKKSFALFLYEVSDGEDTLMFSPTRYVDISRTESRKREACYAHASQTPDRYYALQSQVARFRGVESGFRQAEAFVEHVGGPSFSLP